VGEVVAAGEGTKTPVGTLGAVFLMEFCGECRSCRAGATNQCLAKRGDMGFSRDGGYAPYELVSESIFFPVGEGITPTEATLLLDIMGTGGHAIRRGLRTTDEVSVVLVAGAGPIGLGVLAMAKLMMGAEQPVAIFDQVPYRLDLAKRLGGLPIDLRQEALPEGFRRHGLAPADLAIDTSGKEAARRICLDALGQRGTLVCVGHGEKITLDVSADLISTERAVLGSEYFRFDELPANLSLLRKHREYLGQIVTHRFSLEEIQAAFELFWSGQTGKVVVEQ